MIFEGALRNFLSMFSSREQPGPASRLGYRRSGKTPMFRAKIGCVLGVPLRRALASFRQSAAFSAQPEFQFPEGVRRSLFILNTSLPDSAVCAPRQAFRRKPEGMAQPADPEPEQRRRKNATRGVQPQKGAWAPTITCNLAAISAHQGLRTLVVDLDPCGTPLHLLGDAADDADDHRRRAVRANTELQVQPRRRRPEFVRPTPSPTCPSCRPTPT